MLYSYRVEQAIRAATILHRDQVRKGVVPIPYSTHLIAVALIVADYSKSEDAFIGALLHDTLEDTDYTEDELRQDFGDKVLSIVKAVSEPRDTEEEPHTWQERKKAYAKQLKTAPEEALLIAAADKIHNMRTTVEEYFTDHKRFMKDFGGSIEERALMYQDISNTLNNRLQNDIVGEFNHVYTEYKNFILDVEKSLKK
ncbi:MAG: HD domain-containing protein [Candidatus Paceibacterota bacterium]